MKLLNAVKLYSCKRLATRQMRNVRISVATIAFGIFSAHIPTAHAHCKFWHPHHCASDVYDAAGDVLGAAVDAVSYVGEKIIGGTTLGAKTVWNYSPGGIGFMIADKYLPNPIPYAEYVLKNPDEIIEIVKNPTIFLGSPVAYLIADARNKVLKRGTKPLPPELRAHFKDHFSDELLRSVRYTVGNSVYNGIAPTLSLSTVAKAITLQNVIVFKEEPKSIALWAHELHHVKQYQEWGLTTFAAVLTVYAYQNTESPIEAPAYAFDSGFSNHGTPAQVKKDYVSESRILSDRIDSGLESQLAVNSGRDVSSVAFDKFDGWSLTKDNRYVFGKEVTSTYRNDINRIIASGGKVISVGFAPNDGYSIFYEKDGDKNRYLNRNIPSAAHAKIAEFSEKGYELKTIAFTQSGGWTLLFGKNGYWSNNVPPAAHQKIREIAEAGNTLRSVSYAPNGGWSVFYNWNGYWNSNMPGDSHEQIKYVADQGHGLRHIEFNKYGGWVLLYK